MRQRTAVGPGGRTYLVAAAAWAGLVALFPVWQGQGYLEDLENPGVWRPWGSFGLERTWAPIWDPPERWGGGTVMIAATPAETAKPVDVDDGEAPDVAPPPRNPPAPVRWPWQRATRGNHVELMLWLDVWLAGAGLVVAGLALRLWRRRRGLAHDDAAGVVSWRVTLWLLVVGVVTAAATFGTMGATIELGIPTPAFFAALAAGLAHGIIAWRRPLKPTAQTPRPAR